MLGMAALYGRTPPGSSPSAIAMGGHTLRNNSSLNSLLPWKNVREIDDMASFTEAKENPVEQLWDEID